MPLLLPPNAQFSATNDAQKIAIAMAAINSQFSSTTNAIKFGRRKCRQWMGDATQGANPLGLAQATFEAGITGPQLLEVNQKNALAKVALALAGALESQDAFTPEELPVMKACVVGLLNLMNVVTPDTVPGATITAVEAI